MKPSLNIRPAIVHDIPALLELSWALTLEERETSGCNYPRLAETTRAEMEAAFRQSFMHPLFHVETVLDAGAVVGFATATIIPRLYGEPKATMRLDTIYLTPVYRGTFGHLSTCKELVGAMWKWGFQALAPYVLDEHDRIIEGAFIPGGQSEKLWRAAGLIPYLTLCAWIRPDGTPATANMARYIGD